jgi:hypothetical protein
VDDLSAEEDVQHGAKGQIRTEGNCQFGVFFLDEHYGYADQRADQGAGEDNEQDRFPPQKGAHHGQKFDIAATHAFFSGQPLVAVGHQQQAAAAQQNPQQGIQPGNIWQKKRADKADDDTGQGYLIRNDLVLQVDEGDHHQGRAEQKQDQKRKRRPESEKKRQCQQAVKQFDQRILDGYVLTAAAAFPAQQQVTDQGDVVIPADAVITVGTMGGRRDNRFPLGQAADADIEKRADNHAENQGEQGKHQVGCHQSKLSAKWVVISLLR